MPRGDSLLTVSLATNAKPATSPQQCVCVCAWQKFLVPPQAAISKLTFPPAEVKDTRSGSERVLRLSGERFSLV